MKKKLSLKEYINKKINEQADYIKSIDAINELIGMSQTQQGTLINLKKELDKINKTNVDLFDEVNDMLQIYLAQADKNDKLFFLTYDKISKAIKNNKK